MSDIRTPDAAESFVDRSPPPLRPYLRLIRADRPVGTWLLFLPCLWGVLAARPEDFEASSFWRLALLFGIGAFAMRSAGCVYNDIVDRDVDAKVSRTASRPIPAGEVRVAAAAALLVGLSLAGLAVLLQLGATAILLGIGSLALVAAYPFMKRITWWPQAWLGLTFNWGVLVGAAAASGTVPPAALLLYAGGVFWTLGYDTIYASQDKEDDALVGVKSSVRRLGPNARAGVAVFYAAAVLLIACGLYLAGMRGWLLLLLPAGLHLGWQALRFDPDEPRRALGLFRANVWTGALVAMACLAA